MGGHYFNADFDLNQSTLYVCYFYLNMLIFCSKEKRWARHKLQHCPFKFVNFIPVLSFLSKGTVLSFKPLSLQYSHIKACSMQFIPKYASTQQSVTKTDCIKSKSAFKCTFFPRAKVQDASI